MCFDVRSLSSTPSSIHTPPLPSFQSRVTQQHLLKTLLKTQRKLYEREECIVYSVRYTCTCTLSWSRDRENLDLPLVSCPRFDSGLFVFFPDSWMHWIRNFVSFFPVFLLLILGSQPPFTPSCLQSSSLFWCYFFSLVLVPDKDILASRIFSVVANIGTRRGIKRFSRAWDYYFCKDSLFSKACYSLYLWMWHSLYVWHFFYAIRVKNEEKLQHLHLLFTWSLGIQQK